MSGTQQSQELAVREEVGGYAIVKDGIEKSVAASKANFGAGGISEWDLDRVAVPSGGGVSWAVPTLAGTSSVEEIVGVVVYAGDRRAYWETSYDEEPNKPPDCHSLDAVRGSGTIAATHDGLCHTCPKAQWGTKENSRGEATKGQACQTRKMIFIFRESDRLPLHVNLAPTSLRDFRKYLVRLTSAGRPMYSVLTGLKLRVESDPVKHSVVVPRMVGLLSDDVAESFRKISQALTPMFTQVKIARRDDEAA